MSMSMSERMTGNAALMTLQPCDLMRESVIGIHPRPGCTPLAAPPPFSQYPCKTLPAASVGRPCRCCPRPTPEPNTPALR